MNQLIDKIAVVTGASRGIGKAIALAFADEGADVVCVARSAQNAAATADAIKEKGRQAWAFGLDVSDPSACQEFAATVIKETGRLDVLVNNAGITRDGLLMRMTEEDWNAVLDTNLRGAFALTKAFTRPMMKQRSGRIINVASVIGLMGNAGQANYAASKAGLIGFTKSIARELATRGITANALAPGFICTDMTSALDEEQTKAIKSSIPLGKLGSVEDIAAAALFLAGPGASYITGQVLAVDGGMVMA